MLWVFSCLVGHRKTSGFAISRNGKGDRLRITLETNKR